MAGSHQLVEKPPSACGGVWSSQLDPQRKSQQIVELHIWAAREGLRGTAPATLFEGLCRRLVDAGVPLWRAFAGIPTLHPQWGGYAYTWWRDRDAIEPTQFERGEAYEQEILNSPIGYLVRQAEAYGEAYACGAAIHGGTSVGDSRDPRCSSISPFSRRSPPPAPPIILLRSSVSARAVGRLTS
jgi:hypothetical protein